MLIVLTCGGEGGGGCCDENFLFIIKGWACAIVQEKLMSALLLPYCAPMQIRKNRESCVFLLQYKLYLACN